MVLVYRCHRLTCSALSCTPPPFEGAVSNLSLEGGTNHPPAWVRALGWLFPIMFKRSFLPPPNNAEGPTTTLFSKHHHQGCCQPFQSQPSSHARLLYACTSLSVRRGREKRGDPRPGQVRIRKPSRRGPRQAGTRWDGSPQKFVCPQQWSVNEGCLPRSAYSRVRWSIASD